MSFKKNKTKKINTERDPGLEVLYIRRPRRGHSQSIETTARDLNTERIKKRGIEYR